MFTQGDYCGPGCPWVDFMDRASACVALEADVVSVTHSWVTSHTHTHIVCHLFLEVSVSTLLLPATDAGARFEEVLSTFSSRNTAAGQ